MLIHDLVLNEFLSHDIESGFPSFGSERLLIVGGNRLVELLLDLSEQIGMERMRPVLCRFGFKTGLALAQNIAGINDYTTPKEWIQAGFMLGRMAGIANVGDVQIAWDSRTRRIELSGEWHDSISMTSWMSKHDDLSQKPECAVLCSIYSGIASAALGEEVIVRETHCQAMGDPNCIFEGRRAVDWGDLAGQLRPYPPEDLARIDLADISLRARRNRGPAATRSRGFDLEPITDRPLPGAENGIVYRSREMHHVMTLAGKVAPTRSSVLILGESGVGKEMIAQFVHRNSSARNARFLAVNCAALPQPLLESELFGHVKGAFTGAHTRHDGLFVEAGEGTLFLDEIGELSPDLQAKLLRVLNEREVRPVGGLTHTPVAARIIAATNQQLQQQIESGGFRRDLFFRLAVFPIEIPPLRQRRQDILMLARHFIEIFHPGHPGLSQEAVRCLYGYTWQGNVRELKNWIEFALILAGEERIQPDHLPPAWANDAESTLNTITSDLPPLKEVEARYARHVMAATGGIRSETARILGVSEVTLWRKLKSGVW